MAKEAVAKEAVAKAIELPELQIHNASGVVGATKRTAEGIHMRARNCGVRSADYTPLYLQLTLQGFTKSARCAVSETGR